MKHTLYISAALLLLAGPALAQENPFAKPSSLPYQAPRFDLIKDRDYQPAFDTAMKQHIAEIEAIAASTAAPTFDNTIAAIERSGRMLERVANTFFSVAQANSNPALEKVETAMAPRLAAHTDAIYLNPKLFARVKALHDKRQSLKLDGEALQTLTLYYKQFVHAGANLNQAGKTRLMAINKQAASLETSFQQKLLAGTKAGGLVLDNKSDLAGLSDAEIASAADAAKARGLKGKYVLPLQNTTQQPLLTSLANRSVRERLFNASWTRTEKGDANDTRGIISQLALLRTEKAQLLGYANYSAYVLYDQMAENAQAVEKFIGQLVPATRAKAAEEARLIQSAINKEGGKFQLKPWDWQRYAERVRKERYDLDEAALKPYFEINRVLREGVLHSATRLYGITFKRRTDIPVYHPDVMVYEVFEQDGHPLGLMYFDLWKRDNKRGGAWMSNYVGQSKLFGTKPVIYNVSNFTKPAAGQPALISFEDVGTMFHEFGHALHGLFANQTYPLLSGTNVARDFVEFPSQFNEHWALHPEILKRYAVHYKTGVPMPQSLVDRIKKSQTWGQGYALGELLAASQLDLQWHALPPGSPKQDVNKFEIEALKKTGTDFPNVPTRYRSSYFLHIWANGYASSYYAYQWTVMLDTNAFAWFNRNGGMTRANGQRFRDLILSKGHTMDYGPMFRAFYGKDPEIGPMLEHRGLVPPK
ncbi:MAG: M3 family metallopeptidase [Pseudomonadota bacterium]